ncbi:glycosyltransferase family 4 protein [Dolichospermum circinale]|uniref:glycosyltransferase family 4 protein n=1 Tax=Dolichospermum circinale TaxID=109265 RepID=UPI00232DBBCE|nr:glycosyltransferase family 1 protein [Dolichospermum circinale]MDB9547593.1 glycosyltransferase family 1 protein [Dolichospermum circinale CS-1031]
MKVALFISQQIPQAGGGHTFESQLLQTIVNLAALSNHQFVFYTSSEEVPNYLLSTSIQVVSLHRSLKERIKSKILRTAKAILSKIKYPRSKFEIEGWYEKHIINLLKINQIDITLSLVPGSPVVDYPYITTVWDLQHRLNPYFPEVSISGEWDNREKFYLKMLRQAAFIITGTEVGKAEIEKFYHVPAERIKVVPFFTPQFTSTFKLTDQDIIKKYNLPSQYLFYPAQFWPHKNHISLLLAIKLLKEKYDIEFPLVFVGSDKGNESYVREMVQKLNLSQQVYFLGFVPQEDMVNLYGHAFALTFMTFFGPDNLPPLEAMALGCPVIASNVSGAKEQLGDAALLVDPKKPEEIAEAIKSLSEDSALRQDLIERGLIRASQWTAQDYVKEIFSVIDDFETIRRCWK